MDMQWFCLLLVLKDTNHTQHNQPKVNKMYQDLVVSEARVNYFKNIFCMSCTYIVRNHVQTLDQVHSHGQSFTNQWFQRLVWGLKLLLAKLLLYYIVQGTATSQCVHLTCIVDIGGHHYVLGLFSYVHIIY